MKDLELRRPNDEQLLAVEHEGGVLLSAGAGSGKTFVLVEHIVYLFEKKVAALVHLSVDEVKASLKKDFSQIVIMTFTKKAAGELKLRLKKRFELAEQRSIAGLSEIEAKYWALGEETLSYMYVGTIHGFCFRLIASGMVTGISADVGMINDVEHGEKIGLLLEGWIKNEFESLSDQHKEFVLYNKKLLKKAIINIYKDPDLRLLWRRKNEGQEFDINSAIGRLLSFWFNDWRGLFAGGQSYVSTSDKKKLKWEEFLDHFKRDVSLESPWHFLCSLKDLFDRTPRLPAVKEGKVPDHIYDFFQGIKNLKKDLVTKKYFEDIQLCFNHSDQLKDWTNVVGTIYEYIEENYLTIDGITFSDLEYYVFASLSNEKTQEAIGHDYNYFIVDEFQDTSQIQFSIIKRIINDDMKKVFSVGDVKQAIYGFRGGELGVFQDAQEKTYQNLSLKNNYRSHRFVIEFNNSLYTYLLPSGLDFDGKTDRGIEMSCQNVPEGKEEQGSIIKQVVQIRGELDEGKKPSTAEINYFESKEIFSYISEHEDENKCVLYSKLRPSLYLLTQLIDEGIDFRFQVKVPFNEDPHIALFGVLANFHALIKENKEEEAYSRAAFYVRTLRALLNLPLLTTEEITSLLDKTKAWESSFGALETFKRFLWEQNILTSSIHYAWSLIKVLCDIGGDHFEYINEYIKMMSTDSYSIELERGQDPDKLIVMTVHASKGLEFDTVLLGGIHTNGDQKSSLESFGKKPFSYKWLPKGHERKLIKTPDYILEYEESKLKDFEESKRLFYVATTRAVEKLVWCDLSLNDKELYFAKNSWICALRKWESSGIDNQELLTHMQSSSVLLERDIHDYNIKNQRLDLKPAMIHIDPLGVLEKSNDDFSPLVLSSELSVTRLTALAECPRKFYLKNLLKIEPVEGPQTFLDKKITEESEEGVVSSANRGTLVHHYLSQAINKNLSLSLECLEDETLDNQTRTGMEWVLDKLKEYKDLSFHFISEEPVKFALFEQMISGTPDLILHQEKNSIIEVWDFKTGGHREADEQVYWIQLLCYSFAMMAKFKSCKQVNMKLVYVDERKVLEKEMTFKEVEEGLYQVWSKLENLDQINLDHCTRCDYQQTCHP